MSIEDTIPVASTESTTKAAVKLYTPRLPPELWLIIFGFATSSPITYHPSASWSDSESTRTTTSCSSSYEPFQTPRHESTTIALADAAIRDRCAISLVCKQWYTLASDMRYEDIRIGRGIDALCTALSGPARDLDRPITDSDSVSLPTPPSPPSPSRHRVRRAVLPYAYTATPTHHAPPALALLALLPHLEVLVRPPISPLSSLLSPSLSHRRTLIPITATTIRSFPSFPRFEFPTESPALPALRRLEWAFDKTGAATRAGGINSLTDMLKVSPSLSELVLTGIMPYKAVRQDRLHLPSLRTLRFRTGASGCPFVNQQTTYWEMPALENIVIEGGGRAKAIEELWRKFGGQVRVVQLEIGEDGGEGMSMGDVGEIVDACPELVELNFRIGCGHLNSRWSPTDEDVNGISAGYVHGTLQRLGICVDVDSDDLEWWSVRTWMALAKFVGEWKTCSALRQVVLFVRGVEVVEQNPQFHLFRGELASSGRQLLLRSVYTGGGSTICADSAVGLYTQQ